MSRCARRAIFAAAFLLFGFLTARWLAGRRRTKSNPGETLFRPMERSGPGPMFSNPATSIESGSASKSTESQTESLEYCPAGADCSIPAERISGTIPLRLVVLKDEGIMELIEGESLIAWFPVSIGSNPDLGDKLGPGDRRTPEGVFSIISMEDSSHWEMSGRKTYGPWFLRLDTGRWRGIGIHGTDEPEKLGQPSSEGCIRVANAIVSELRGFLPIGTMVEIRRRRS